MNKINIYNVDLEPDFDDAGQPSIEIMKKKQRGRGSVPPTEKLKSKLKTTQHETERSLFNENLKVGSRILCNLGNIVDGYSGTPGARPAIVYALWRDQDQNIKKIEFFSTTTQMARAYASDFIMVSDLQKRFKSDRPGKLGTGMVYLADNAEKYFPTTYIQQIDKSLWPEILVRRAYALFHSRSLSLSMAGDAESGLIREGFTFNEIEPHNLSTKNTWAPDMLGGDFERMASPFVSPDVVNVISRFAASHFISNNEVFPPFKDWNLKLPFNGYPDWEEGDLAAIPHALRMPQP